MCGENGFLKKITNETEGSPPRVRGKPCSARISWSSRRITPACAGKTSAYSSIRAVCGDHPRVCGENDGGGKHRSREVGSPPRVRGKRQEKPVIIHHLRITPACAGKT